MKADSLKIAKVFSTGGDVHYALPHFQREYAWEKENWKTLLVDVFSIYDVYADDSPPEHFMGTLVVINDGTRSGTVPVFRLVDGQQRLTTISLILSALGRIVIDSHPTLNKKIQRLLINEDEKEDLFFKLLPTTKYGDRVSYQAIIWNKQIPPVESKIPIAFEYILRELHNRISQGLIDPEKFFVVLTTCLQAVFIDLDNRERPYEIFESLNFKGKTLTQADLVRNYIAMKLPQDNQAEVFNEYWSPIEEMLQEKRTVGRSRLGELTAFLRHYMAFLSGILINEEHVYSRFRDRGQQLNITEFIEEIKTLKRFAGYYDRMLRPDKEPNLSIRNGLNRLNILEFSTGYSFLLFAYDAMENGLLSTHDFVKGLRTLEVYMVRRFLAHESTNYLNKMFPSLKKEIEPQSFDESLRKALATKNFPSDSRLRKTVESIELYDRSSQTRQKLTLVLETINRALSEGSGGYTILDGNPTIEHILPQSLSNEWRDHLGTDYIQDFDLRHTLGNLTLVTQEWNSGLSNGAYQDKRKKLANHALQINSKYFAASPEIWNRDAIKARAQFLLDEALQMWPEVAPEVLPEGASGEKPKSLIILGESFSVNTWRDVVQHSAEAVSQLASDFEAIAKELPAYLSRHKFERACRQLSNGWWVYVHLSGNDARMLSERMIDLAGIPEDEFELETW